MKLTKKDLDKMYEAIIKSKPASVAEKMIANFSKEKMAYFKSTTNKEMPFGLPVIKNENMPENTFVIVDKKGRPISMGRI